MNISKFRVGVNDHLNGRPSHFCVKEKKTSSQTLMEVRHTLNDQNIHLQSFHHHLKPAKEDIPRNV